MRKSKYSDTIVFTGGHHTPALAVIDELLGVKPDLNLVWFGHKHSLRGDASISIEYQEIKGRGYQFINLWAGKFYNVTNPLELVRIPLGLLHALWLLVKAKPVLVFSFGGYLAFPTVLAAWILRIPTVTHEQTVTVGLANKVISHLSRLVFISWPESASSFPASKVILTGNPVRDAIFKVDPLLKREISQEFSKDKKTLYITGGKQGAHVINRVVSDALRELMEQFNVIHQCGAASQFKDYDSLCEARLQLPVELRGQYVVKEFFSEQEVGTVLNLADILVSRAGANIVTEVALLGKVELLIPIPHTSCQEQEKNADLIAMRGAANVLAQADLRGETLILELDDIRASYEHMQQQAQSLKQLIPSKASERIVHHLREHFPEIFR